MPIAAQAGQRLDEDHLVAPLLLRTWGSVPPGKRFICFLLTMREGTEAIRKRARIYRLMVSLFRGPALQRTHSKSEPFGNAVLKSPLTSVCEERTNIHVS